MPGVGPISDDIPSICFIFPPSLLFTVDSISTSATEAILANASPLNHNVCIWNRSSTVEILLVLYRSQALDNSSIGIPCPLSVIWIVC